MNTKNDAPHVMPVYIIALHHTIIKIDENKIA